MKSTFLLFLSRLLTKSGDNAWHFAVPLALVHIYPDTLRPVSLFFLAVRLGLVFVLPVLGRMLDRISRLRAIQASILPQIPLTICLTLLIAFLNQTTLLENNAGEATSGLKLSAILAFSFLTGLTILSQAISHLSSVLVTADFIPHLFQAEKLTRANTILRRIDLITEIVAPIVAGSLLFSIGWNPFLQSGFVLIAAWNLSSFLLEFAVLRSFLRRGALPLSRTRLNIPSEKNAARPWRSLAESLSLFSKQIAFLPMLGLAVMHITVLSGPNIIGSSFLKAGWNLTETVIGLFRATGAVVSIVATMFIGSQVRKHGLAKAAARFSAAQALFIFLAACAFEFGRDAAWLYLGCIVLSRFGHSGFIICEMQIRQETVPEQHLGLVNGLALSINSVGSLVILFLGVLLGDLSQFGILVWTSAAAISSCAFTCRYWAKYGKGHSLGRYVSATAPNADSPTSQVEPLVPHPVHSQPGIK